MKPLFFPFVAALLILNSCNTSKNPLFGKATPHEKYANSLQNAGLAQSALAREWIAAAENSMNQPQKIEIPFQETGYFAAEIPRAASYLFDVKQGEKIYVSIQAVKDSATKVFAEVYKTEGTQKQLLQAFESIDDTIRETVKTDGSFLIRIQPELLVSLEYTIKVTSGPSLAFPVAESGNPRFISYWGAGRDAGKRKHEGIDIQAKRRTPALAAANGIVFRVGDNRLGGKIVFLRDEETGNSLYYAHLDSQIAKTGERVKIGDTLGLVGNTGNAIHTPPHLHFGIYTIGGAINPFPFINPEIETPEAVRAPLTFLNKWVRTTNATELYKWASGKADKLTTLARNEAVKTLAATANWYKVITPEGNTGYVRSGSITDKPLQTIATDSVMVLLSFPAAGSVPKMLIASKSEVRIAGTHGDYQLITAEGVSGWALMP